MSKNNVFEEHMKINEEKKQEARKATIKNPQTASNKIFTSHMLLESF